MTTTTTTQSTSTTSPRGPRREGSAPRRPRREGGFADRPKDVDQKILGIRRVTRVVAGGRRMSFAVSMVIGDKNGVVGVGTGKGNDTALAIAKALKDAKKNAIKIKRTEPFSIPFDVKAKYNASRVMLFPNNGKGIVVGAALRDIVTLAGLKDVSGKVISGSKNKLNTARAAIKALSAVATKHSFVATASAPKAPEGAGDKVSEAVAQ
ncbi:30S ribosomal protein S5 [Candidatus Nomurabacteria bacterium]|nr:30S ribosomal protein S5 [Candidatus Nomurabacteria bacterium]